MCRRNEEVLLLQSGNCRWGLHPNFAKVTTFEKIFPSKLLKQGYHMERLKLSFRKFYGRYGDLQQYEGSLSRMLNDNLSNEQKFDFQIDQTFHQFHDLDTELGLHWIMSGFQWAFATGVACQHENLPVRTPGSVPLFGTCLCSNCWDQITRTCHVVTWLFTLNTLRCFLDFAYISLGYIEGKSCNFLSY